MIERFYTSTITVKRMVYVSDKATIATNGTIIGHIQRVSGDQILHFDSSLNITHQIWCDKSSDVQIGDVLVSDSQNYTVRRIQKNIVTPTGLNQHLEVFAEQTS